MGEVVQFPYEDTPGYRQGLIYPSADGSKTLEAALHDEVWDALARMAEEDGVTMDEKLADCIATESDIRAAVNAGKKVLLQRGVGRSATYWEVIFPT